MKIGRQNKCVFDKRVNCYDNCVEICEGKTSHWTLILEAPTEKQLAEQQKKQELYDPNVCPEMNDAGCIYPDCHDCEVDYDDD